MKYLIIDILKLYKTFVSPFLPPSCRFTPTCSEYAMQAVERYGFLRGSWMAFKRLLRCQPFCEGGHDPVPDQMKGEKDQGSGNNDQGSMTIDQWGKSTC